MRIIGGKWRSRRLVRPRTSDTRPMPDRVREAVFSILGARFACPGALPPFRVADVFAGSGSMGLEALSRGADSCCFFERAVSALEALRENLATLAVGSEAHIVSWDAWNSSYIGLGGCPFDLVLLDPPYADTRDLSDQSVFKRYLRRIAECDDNRPLVVLHHRASVQVATRPEEEWRVVDQRTFGTNAITLFER